MKIYLAGPLFTTAERQFNLSLAYLLRDKGHEVWLPQEHEPMREVGLSMEKSIFLTDVQGIDQSDAIVANMDGPDPDSGTSWETGYAYAKGKKVITFRTDFRKAGDGENVPYNLMLSESSFAKLNAFNPFSQKPREILNRLASDINKVLKGVE